MATPLAHACLHSQPRGSVSSKLPLFGTIIQAWYNSVGFKSRTKTGMSLNNLISNSRKKLFMTLHECSDHFQSALQNLFSLFFFLTVLNVVWSLENPKIEQCNPAFWPSLSCDNRMAWWTYLNILNIASVPHQTSQWDVLSTYVDLWRWN